ncbi:hypothetical protein M408DRAFT_332844 [Serendipita vermifera MAFF 305830]|uniref:Uncharacterized protein n=1 Tax=Serendipita vermifera MAFF 305830 TaxID=933852 RepID=A0A0C2WZF8_SERVB|nr:hypothetical protein M408DRAFT_332844 [Serendipita vermifera MAFF 305830]
MQAIRTLRAQSRPASPAPAFADGNNVPSVTGTNKVSTHTQPTTWTTNEEAQQPQRPNSAMARIQSLAPFHKRVAFTPPPSPKPAPSTIVQDGTYLNTLGLKLNEAATRVLAPVSGNGTDSWKGKKPLQAGRGRQFASLVETELDASQGNTNLRHAILRLLPRSLTVIVSSLSVQVSQLIPTPGYVPSTVMAAPHPTTLHALSLAVFAGEILETFTTYKLATASSDLAAIYGHLDTIIMRVISPLFAQMQSEMTALLEPVGQPPTTSVTNSPGPNGKPAKPHSAIITLGQYMPGFTRILKRCAIPYSQGSQKALATFLISTTWQALVQLSHRAPSSNAGTMVHKASAVSLALSQMSLTPPSSPPPSIKKKLTPPSSPPSKKRVLALPGASDSPPKGVLRLRRVPSGGSTGSRSSSPDTRQREHQRAAVQQSLQASAAWLSTLLLDTRALGDMLVSTEVPRPEEGSLAREAVDEALERFGAFREWIGGAVNACAMSSSAGEVLGKLMDSVPEEMPLLIVLPVLLGQAWLARPQFAAALAAPGGAPVEGEREYPGVAKLIGYESEETYRRGVLCGFRRAEECEGVIAQCLLGRLGPSSPFAWAEGVSAWLARNADT